MVKAQHPKLEDEQWLREQVSSKPVRHIALDLGLSYTRVYTAVKKFGIEIPKRTKYVYTDESRKEKSDTIKAALRVKYPDGRYGELSSNWRGGISQIGLSIRKSSKYQNWRMEVFKRDNFACIKCQSRIDIEADHIKPFALILEENNIRSLKDAIQHDELWDIANGQTLCRKHHKETETHSARLKPIIPQNDNRTEHEKQVDALLKSKDYYQKRNSYLQARHKEMKQQIKLFQKQIEGKGRVIRYESVIPKDTEELYDKRIALLEQLLLDNGVSVPSVGDD